jgi:hypothetical protein
MAKVQSYSNLGTLKTIADYVRYASPIILALVNQVNGGLQFDDNLKTQTVNVTFGASNANTKVTHNLGKATTTYIVAQLSAQASIYLGSGSAMNVIYLKASSPCQATLIIF